MAMGAWVKKPSSGSERLKRLMAEYGPVAVVVYIAIALTVFVSAYFLGSDLMDALERVGLNVRPKSAEASTAIGLGGAYIVYKATQPLRILVTLLATPLIARLYRRFRPAPTRVE
jgi:hypothetical protein